MHGEEGGSNLPAAFCAYIECHLDIFRSRSRGPSGSGHVDRDA